VKIRSEAEHGKKGGLGEGVLRFDLISDYPTLIWFGNKQFNKTIK